MPAVAHFPEIEPTKPLSLMTTAELKAELKFWSDEMQIRNRWGDTVEPAFVAINQIEAEISRRYVSIVRNPRVELVPFACSAPAIAGPVITGAAKARSEHVPSRSLMAVAFVCLSALALLATVMASQTVWARETHYAAKGLV